MGGAAGTPGDAVVQIAPVHRPVTSGDAARQIPGFDEVPQGGGDPVVVFRVVGRGADVADGGAGGQQGFEGFVEDDPDAGDDAYGWIVFQQGACGCVVSDLCV
jgi:hypothetical protein